MTPTSAVEFLSKFADQFENPEVRGWIWLAEDDEFNKTASWSPGVSGGFLNTIATVDLGLTMLLLTITERIVEDSEGADSEITFSASIAFEDRTISLNDEPLTYDEESITSVIAQFNAATAS